MSEEEHHDVRAHSETPKRRTGYTPLIQVTYRATENPDLGTSGSSTVQSCCRQPSAYQGSQAPVRSHLRRHHDVMCGTTSSGSTCSSCRSGAGRFTSDDSTSSSSTKWHALESPQVLRLQTSDCILESNLKGMHLSRSCSTNRSDRQAESLSSSSSSKKLFSTPNRVSCSQQPSFNPFESNLLETMNCSSMSSSVFSKVVTPSNYETTDVFSWGVDNIAILYPADIDENACNENHHAMIDPEMEERVQHAINSFFAQKSFVLSPWTETGMCQPSSSYPSCLSSPLPPNLETHSDIKAKQKELRLTLLGSQDHLQTKDVWCQTVLSIPLHVDLEHILSKYFTFSECQTDQNDHLPDDQDMEVFEADSRDGMSVSSLRRKLFSNYEERAATPDQCLHTDYSVMNDPVYRLHLSPRTPDRENMASPTSTASAQFSSSPIGKFKTRTTMTPPTDLVSPTVSPIKPSDSNEGNSRVALPSQHQGGTAHTAVHSEDHNRLRPLAQLWKQVDSSSAATSKMSSMMEMSNLEGGGDQEVNARPLPVSVINQDLGYHTMSTGSSIQESIQSMDTSAQMPMLIPFGSGSSEDTHSTACLPGKMACSSSLQEALKQAHHHHHHQQPPVNRDKNCADAGSELIGNDNTGENSSAMMWSPIGASTPSTRGRFDQIS